MYGGCGTWNKHGTERRPHFHKFGARLPLIWGCVFYPPGHYDFNLFWILYSYPVDEDIQLMSPGTGTDTGYIRICLSCMEGEGGRMGGEREGGKARRV